MLKLNIKIAFRNLLKNKMYTGINIIGLAIGLSGIIFVLLYINHERSYDHWDASLNRVYKVQELDFWEIKEGKKEWMEGIDSRIGPLLKESMPQIEAVTVVGDLMSRAIILENQAPFLQENIGAADSSFFRIFPFHFRYGNGENALSRPGSLVIKEKLARQYFGALNPVGKTIQINQSNWTKPETFTITGVVSEPETPASVNFELIYRGWREHKQNDHFYAMANVYIKTHTRFAETFLNQSAQALYAPFKRSLFERQKFNYQDYVKMGVMPQIRLVPFQEIHQKPLSAKSWFDQIKPVILLSSLLLLVSVINFINMFTAQAVTRAKEVGVKKVIGANRSMLIVQFLWETAFQCFIALLLSVILIEGLLPYLNQAFNLSLSFMQGSSSLLVMAQLVLLLTLITLLSGIYPALFLSAYRPQQVLKGNFVHSSNGKGIRSVLVGLQFVVAVGFFIGVLILSRQLAYMMARDPGYNPESVICINMTYNSNFAERIKRIEGVQYVGSDGSMISSNRRFTGLYKWNNEVREWRTNLIKADGLQAIGAKLVKGRLFDQSRVQDSAGTAILNESLERIYGGNMVGKYIEIADSIPYKVQVIGIIKDMQISGFEHFIEPTLYTMANKNATGYPNTGVNYIIRFENRKQAAVMAGLEKTWKEKFAAFPFTFSYVKDDLSRVIKPHERFRKMVNVFSFMSITLSLIGLLALAAFLTQQRKKEIAIRKILGAGDKSLFILLNKNYFWLIVGANVLAWPLIYLAVNQWLSGFAYRIEVPLMPFIIALLVSVVMTAITVSLQVKKAIKASPVDALKYE